MGLDAVPAAYRGTCGAAVGAARRRWGERLASLALYGSAARGTAGPGSDVDLLAVVREAPTTFFAMLDDAAPVEAAARAVLAGACAWGGTGPPPVAVRIFLPEDLAPAPPILLDLTEDAIVLWDDGTLARALSRLHERLRELGSRRVWLPDGTWYWDLKPDLVAGEVFSL